MPSSHHQGLIAFVTRDWWALCFFCLRRPLGPRQRRAGVLPGTGQLGHALPKVWQLQLLIVVQGSTPRIHPLGTKFVPQAQCVQHGTHGHLSFSRLL
eukprot:3326758-Amphidinium_carterae.1